MHRKHYKAIADAIMATRSDYQDDPNHDAAEEVLDILTSKLAYIMRLDNPWFDRERFYTAAGHR